MDPTTSSWSPPVNGPETKWGFVRRLFSACAACLAAFAPVVCSLCALFFSLYLFFFFLFSLFGRLYMHAFAIDRQGVAYRTAPPHCNYDGFRFLGQSTGQWPGLLVLGCRCSPHFLPLTVLSHKCVRQVESRYCHTIVGLPSPFFECPFFFTCVFLWSGSCPMPFFG